MVDIYLCHHCLGPIWFPFGQKTHFGTGWECWKKSKGAGETTVVDDLLEAGAALPPDVVDAAVRSAVEQYRAWVGDPGDTRILGYLQRQLRPGRVDVLRAFFSALSEERSEPARRLVDRLVVTPAWRRFATRQISKRSRPARVPRGTSLAARRRQRSGAPRRTRRLVRRPGPSSVR